MSGTGYTIKNPGAGNSGPINTYDVVPADGTIAVERTEEDNVVKFAIKTTYDGYETISCGSGYASGYFKAVHIKFNEENKRYRLVCILNGGSYTPVAKDFGIYYIKFGWRTGGANADHWYIEDYSRQGNGSYVALEQIALNEYNVLIYTPENWAYANIGILKEDKEPNVTIEHFNGNTQSYTPTGTIITTDTPNWKNGSPAVWSVIPEVQNPVIGQLGHYYNGDRNLYFYDGYNWHNVYTLAQGVASLLATTDRPATANKGSIYYDTTEQNLKIYYGGEWKTIINFIRCLPNDTTYTEEGILKYNGRELRIWINNAWQLVQCSAIFISTVGGIPSAASIGALRWFNTSHYLIIYGATEVGNKWLKARFSEEVEQVVTFTNSSGETIAAKECEQIIVTASFGSISILDFSNITKEEGKTIEINILSGAIIRVKDGTTELDLNGCNESVVKAICLNNSWNFYKVSGITQVQ